MFKIFRTIFFFSLFTPWTLIMASSVLVVTPLGFKNWPTFVHYWWSRIGLALAGVKIEADTSHLDPSATYLFMANHQSLFDILVLSVALKPWDVRFVAKESLFQIPVFGAAMRKAGDLAIDRGNRRKAMKALEGAVQSMHDGRSLVLFPEGTRSTDFSRLGRFKVGGMILALKSEMPIVPLVISGTGDIKPKDSPFIHSGPVRLRILSPEYPSKTYSLKQREDMRVDLQKTMDEAYEELAHG